MSATAYSMHLQLPSTSGNHYHPKLEDTHHAVVTRNSLDRRISIRKLENKVLRKITELKHETGLNGKCRILDDEEL
jgi:hypothetical protein